MSANGDDLNHGLANCSIQSSERSGGAVSPIVPIYVRRYKEVSWQDDISTQASTYYTSNMTTVFSGLNNRNSKKTLPLNRTKAKPIFGHDDDDDDANNDPGTEYTDHNAKSGIHGLQAGKKTAARPLPPSSSSLDASSPPYPHFNPSNKNSPHLPPKPPSTTKTTATTTSTTNLSALHTQRQRAAEAEALDPSIYDYDAAFDSIHAHDARKKNTAAAAAAAERQPRYMEKALAAAEVRKRDQLRAKDKMLQREREAEGEDFADKAKYVTGAYKRQQEEVRRMEEEERRKEERERERRRRMGLDADGDGTGRFLYRSLMEEEDKRARQREVAAEMMAGGGGSSSLKEKIADDDNGNNDNKEKSQADIARDLNAKGANIVINEDGEVAIKTQLLSAGLNVAPKPKSKLQSDGASKVPGAGSGSGPGPTQAMATGRTSTQKAVRERQTRLVEEQLAQAAKRAAEEENEEQAKLVKAAKSRKTEGEISSARERYLKRKAEAAAEAEAEREAKAKAKAKG